MLTARGLQHRFAGRSNDAPAALDLPELVIAAGRLTVIRGPSGSGKTTLLYVLSGLLKPTAGHIAWDGVDLAAMSEGARDRWRRTHAGFMFQNFNLIEEMDPLGNVTVAAYFSAFSAAGLRQRGAALLEQFGVVQERRRVDTYSRGEQQRIAMARALMFDPPILFADEPTASLDTGNSAELCGVLRRLAAEGRTVVAVSHDPLLIATADEVIVLDHGRQVRAEDAA